MSANAIASSALLLALVLGFQQPPVPPQEGPPPVPQEGDVAEAVTWPLASDALNERIAEEILGPWQVVSAEFQTASLPKGSATGYALFVPGYLSLEVHMRMPSQVPGRSGLYFQTGTHRWRLNSAGRMETFSLIGTHNFTFDAQEEFQPPGQRRLFDVTLDGDQLLLVRTGETRLVLRRLGVLPFPGEDPEFGFKTPAERAAEAPPPPRRER